MPKIDFRRELSNICPILDENTKIYCFGAGRYFAQMRNAYRCLADISLEEEIFAFIDNSLEKQGTFYFGRPIISPGDIDRNNSVIIVSSLDADESMLCQCMDIGFLYYNNLFRCNIFWILYRYWQFATVMDLKDSENGRCFIAGNGKSLTVTDLEKLTNEKTFGLNKIYKIFDRTKWRPTYYCAFDRTATDEVKNVISDFSKSTIFLRYDYCFWDAANTDVSVDLSNAYFVGLNDNAYYRPEKYRDEIDFGILPDSFALGGTLTYIAIQIAAFLGFKEIYLIGMDNHFPVMRRSNGEIVRSEVESYFISDYSKGSIKGKYEEKGYSAIDIDLVNMAYASARNYCDAHDIVIKNATRGGMLEAFERVDLDSLFL